MSEARVIITRIAKCLDCVSHTTNCCGPDFCYETGREIEDSMQIPDWCPLPKAEKEKD